jgi:hypothetical protein
VPNQSPLYACIVLAAFTVVAACLMALGGCQDPLTLILGSVSAAASVLVVSLIFKYIQDADTYTRKLDRRLWDDENRRNRH